MKPYSPPNKNLLQPFTTLVVADGATSYGLRMELHAANATTFVLSTANGSELERKVVEHHNACSKWTKGYQLGLYYGGQCTAPSRVEVCYTNDTRQ